MSEETEESFDEMEEDFDGDVSEDDIDADIDLADLDDDELPADDDDAAPRPRRTAPAKDDDLFESYEKAVVANPKRASKHQKRARLIEGVLDKATLDTEEGAARAWAALQAQAGDATKRKYAMSEQYTENDVIDHPKFGEGYVVEIVTLTKVAVLFEDGIRKLAHNR